MKDFDYRCNVLAEGAEFKSVAEAIAPLLAAGVRNINVWDGNHLSDIPRALFADRGLCQVIAEYGKPLYVFELTSSVINDRINEYAKASPADRLAYLRKLEETATTEHDKNFVRLVRDMAQINASGQAYAYNPDARQSANYTKGEQEQKNALLDLLSKYGINKVSEPLRRYLNGLNEQQLNDFASMREKFSAMANACSSSQGTGDCVNKDIIRNIMNYRASKGIDRGVQITLYGLGHFSKANDLNEAFPGVSIGVINEPGEYAKSYKNPASGDVDVPDDAYYIKQQRFVKLDTQAAREEFAGAPVAPIRSPRAVAPQNKQRP